MSRSELEPPAAADPELLWSDELLEEVPPDAALDWSDVEELVLSDVLPLADVEPDALPAPEDWLVCAPWFIVEEGLVVVALWLAVAPLEELTLPEPMFTSGLTFAPAFTSVLLMPTFASTPTLGLTLVLLDVEGEVELLESVVEED